MESRVFAAVALALVALVLASAGWAFIIIDRRVASSSDQGAAAPVLRASRIADSLAGGITKSGETYDPRDYVCAVKADSGWRWGELLVLQSTEDAPVRKVVVRVIDLLPKGAPSDIDMSSTAFAALAPKSRGIVIVSVERVGGKR